MKDTANHMPAEAPRMLTTKELASKLSMEPQSIRKRLSQTGSYFGVRPTKLLNRKLYWPVNALDILSESDI